MKSLAEVTDDQCQHTVELVDPPPLKLRTGRHRLRQGYCRAGGMLEYPARF